MADPIAVTPAGVKYNIDDMTDGNNPLARYHTEGKIAAAEALMAEDKMSEESFQYMLTEGKIAAAMADMEARKAAAASAEREAYRFNQQNKIRAVVQGAQNPGLVLQAPATNK